MATIKEQLLDRTRDILQRTPIGIPVVGDDQIFLMNEVFPLHKNWNTILSGRKVKFIIPKRNDYGSKYFTILLDDNTFENISYYECINRKGLKKDILAAAEEAVSDIVLPPLEGGKTKRPDFSSVVRNWINTIDGQEVLIGRYLVYYGTSVVFGDQALRDNFRNYYIQNG